jgi:hypothetical protein
MSTQFYASHETNIDISRSDVLKDLGADKDQVHIIEYDYDLNLLFDPLFVNIVDNIAGSPTGVVTLDTIDNAKLTQVHNTLKSTWDNNTDFAGKVQRGLEKLFQRFTNSGDSNDTVNSLSDGYLSSNIEVNLGMVQTVLADTTHQLRLNMMSASQIKSIAQSLMDLTRFDSTGKLDLAEGDSVVSYSNVSDTDNSGNTDKWEIVLKHVPTPAGPPSGPPTITPTAMGISLGNLPVGIYTYSAANSTSSYAQYRAGPYEVSIALNTATSPLTDWILTGYNGSISQYTNTTATVYNFMLADGANYKLNITSSVGMASIVFEAA